MESGHSDMEVDSIHAAIECAKKYTPINVPSDWQIVCRIARRRKLYIVVPIKNNDILNLNGQIACIDINLNSIPWCQVKWIRYTREGENLAIVYKTDSLDGEFIAVANKKARRSAPKESSLLMPSKAYEGLIPMSDAK